VKLSRDTWLAVGLFLLLALVTAAAATRSIKSQEIPYLSTSSNPDGMLALKLWLNELGIQTLDEPLSTFEPPQNADIILINGWIRAEHSYSPGTPFKQIWRSGITSLRPAFRPNLPRN
jgi:hypothetical protein